MVEHTGWATRVLEEVAAARAAIAASYLRLWRSGAGHAPGEGRRRPGSETQQRALPAPHARKAD
jgi:hypothetical protein